jgi:Zn-dependent protease
LGFTPEILLQRVMLLIPLMLSLTVHEWAHAWSAHKLGDDTAERAGRLSLNPFVHADLIGTIILPLLGIPFGWAKPVPINPARFRRSVRMTTGVMLTASAGPISNFVLAVLATVVIAALNRFAPELSLHGTPTRDLLEIFVLINVALGLFNLIPVPPLDGSRVVEGLLPLRLRGAWESFARFAPLALLAVFWFGPALIAVPRALTLGMLNRLLVLLS